MPVKSITVTDTYVEINDGGNVLQFFFADFPPSVTNNEQRQQHIIAAAQAWLDTRIKVKDLPDDDPAKIADPGLPHFFWEGTGGNKELVARSVLIENVVYDDTQTPPLSFNLRRIYP